MDAGINILRLVLIVLLIMMFGMIFEFSAQDGEKSANLSREVTKSVTKKMKLIQNLDKSKKNKTLDKVEHFIRKLAHFSLYTIVGILTMSLMSTYDIKQMKKMGISLGIGVIYATSDEIHQMFIPDRGSSVGDVIIDSCGVFAGILIVFLGLNGIRAIVNKRFRDKKTNNKFT